LIGCCFVWTFLGLIGCCVVWTFLGLICCCFATSDEQYLSYIHGVNKCTTINYVGRLKEGTGLGPTDRGLYTIYLNRSIKMLGQPYRGVEHHSGYTSSYLWIAGTSRG
jgi:hypothetical protein